MRELRRCPQTFFEVRLNVCGVSHVLGESSKSLPLQRAGTTRQATRKSLMLV